MFPDGEVGRLGSLMSDGITRGNMPAWSRSRILCVAVSLSMPRSPCSSESGHRRAHAPAFYRRLEAERGPTYHHPAPALYLRSTTAVSRFRLRSRSTSAPYDSAWMTRSTRERTVD